MLFVRVLVLFLCTLCTHAYSEQPTTVYLYTYFDKPPFILDKRKQIGLSYDLASALTLYSNNYAFKIVYTPKQRALDSLDGGGGLLWVNPLWVDDAQQVRYLWSDSGVDDSEFYITNDKRLTYEGQSTFSGKIFIGVRGYKYFNLDPLISDGSIERFDLKNERLLLEMLAKERGDFAVMGFQVYYYLMQRHPELDGKIHILTGYKRPFQRYITFSKSHKKAMDEVNTFLKTPRWEELKAKWLVPIPE